MMRFLQALTAAGAVCGVGYYALCIWSARAFRKSVPPPDNFTPPVSILKPLRGTDPDIYSAFRSHCLQDYPEYEIIFGVSDPQDPAAELVKQLQAEFPNRAIRLVICPKALGTNMKVSSLVQMLPLARYEYLIVNDSDIRVPPDYLRRVLGAFKPGSSAAATAVPPAAAKPALESSEQRPIGMVTCLYRGIAGKTIGSHLESVGISTDFIPGALAARELEGIHFGLGSTLAFPRSALQTIGGFEALVDYLADDFELGKRIAAAGYQVEFADVVVDTHVPDYSLGSFFEHQLRWGRSTRHSRRLAYNGLVFTFGVPWAILALLLAQGAPWGWALLGATLAVRLAMAATVGLGVLHDRQLLSDFWLIPLRDVTALIVWIGSYTGRTIAWRGEQFLLKDGKLLPLENPIVGR